MKYEILNYDVYDNRILYSIKNNYKVYFYDIIVIIPYPYLICSVTISSAALTSL